MAEAELQYIGEFNNSSYVILDMMDRRFQLITADTTPAQLALMQEVGPILELYLCIKKSNQVQLINVNGIPWTSNPTRPNIVADLRVEFPLTRATTYLFYILSSVIPPDLINETVHEIFNYAVSSSNPSTIAAAGINIIQVVVDLTVVFVVRPPVRTWLAQSVQDWFRYNDSVVYIARRQPRMILETDLKEQYGFCLSETGAADDNLGDCAVCLEELVVAETNESMDNNLLKMPCSHVFHCQCIFKWLKMSDSCPMCRSIIP